jgi:hypothetical protein
MEEEDLEEDFTGTASSSGSGGSQMAKLVRMMQSTSVSDELKRRRLREYIKAQKGGAR